MRITIVISGSLGDLQPYIALGLGLQRAGHVVRLATHLWFQESINSWGLDFIPLDRKSKGMEQSAKNIMAPIFYPHFIGTELRRSQGSYLDKLFNICQEADALIFGVNEFAVYYIAEKLGLPCYGACLQPHHYTRAFPHPFTISELSLGETCNWLTYVFYDQLLWQYIRQPLNQWRQKTLDLPPISWWAGVIKRMQQQQMPFLYSYSPCLLPKPDDWPDWVHVTGYWFLDQRENWHPPSDLVEFLAAGPPPVSVGFGSVSGWDAEERTKLVLKALATTGQRGLLLTGWGGLSDQIDLPSNVFVIKSAPYDWLFPQVAAAVHHGGTGTLASAMRAGIPSIIIPNCHDHFLWGTQLAKSGFSPPMILEKQLSAERLATAIQVVTRDQTIRTRAAKLGKIIQTENGVDTAVEAFHHHLPAKFKPAY